MSHDLANSISAGNSKFCNDPGDSLSVPGFFGRTMDWGEEGASEACKILMLSADFFTDTFLHRRPNKTDTSFSLKGYKGGGRANI